MDQLLECIQTQFTDTKETDFIQYMKQEYGLHVKYDPNTNRILFRYHRNDRDSTPDFSNPLVQVCRGLICEVNNHRPICYAFNTKLDYELFRETVPWENVRVTRYYDGTLINVYYHMGEWRISTKGVIDANQAYWFSNRSFEELFRETFTPEEENLDTGKCYSFVLQHQENRIVSNVPQNRSILVRVRDLETFIVEPSSKADELTSSWTSYEEMETAVLSMTYDAAGLFLEDTRDNGVHTSIMSPDYVRVAALRTNTPNKVYHLLHLRARGLHDEYLALYPEDRDAMDRVKTVVDKVVECTHNCYQTIYVQKTYVDIPVHLRKLVHSLHEEYYRRKLTNGCKQPAITTSVIKDYFNKLPVSQQYRLTRGTTPC